jgi:hypothetical protein
LRISLSWLYKHHAELPFVVRLGGGLRVSERGLLKWMREKGGETCEETEGSSKGGRSGG